METFVTEKWKDIKGYEEYYQISNMGNVRSKDRVVVCKNGDIQNHKGRQRKVSFSEYRMVVLCKGNKTKGFKVSRLVALHFLKPDESRLVVNHIDYDKYNDCVNNLEWVTYSENALHSLKRVKAKESGIHWCKERKKWTAYIYRLNGAVFVGRFDTREEAVKTQKIKLNGFSNSKY